MKGPRPNATPERRKQYAQEASWVAQIRGELVVGPCEVGGDCKGRMNGHHRNGYDLEHVLDVVWLCARHHQREHAEIRRAAKEESR